MAHFLPRFHKTVLFFVSYRTFIILGQDLGHLGHCLYLALPCFLPSSFTIFCYYCFFSFQKKKYIKKYQFKKEFFYTETFPMVVMTVFKREKWFF